MKCVSQPFAEHVQGQFPNPGIKTAPGGVGQFLGQQDPELSDQIGDALQEQSVQDIAAGGFGLSLVLLPIARFNAEALTVFAPRQAGMALKTSGPMLSPSLEGKDPRFALAVPDHDAGLDRAAGFFRRPVQPSDGALRLSKAIVAD